MRSLVEKYRERKGDLRMVFIDFEKAYDKVSRKILYRYSEARCVSLAYIGAISLNDMYDED